jgi:hypothetical protein
MKGGVRLRGDASGKFWTGWPAKIGNGLPVSLTNEIFKADGLARWSVKHRWLLNCKKPGPRVLKFDYGQKIEFKAGKTITHYYARRCVHNVQLGKREAMAGNADRALMYWAKAETEAERLYSSWLHTLAAKESARVRGNKNGYWVELGRETREEVRRALLSLPEPMRYERGVTALIATREGLSPTQARAHIQALGFGAKNKKHGA